MHWNVGEAGAKTEYTITVENGSDISKTFPAATNVEKAITETAQLASLSSVNVKDSRDVEIEPRDGGKTMSEVGDLTLYPKSSGSA